MMTMRFFRSACNLAGHLLEGVNHDPGQHLTKPTWLEKNVSAAPSCTPAFIPLQPALVRWPGDGQQTYGPVSEAFAEAVADGARAPCHWQE